MGQCANKEDDLTVVLNPDPKDKEQKENVNSVSATPPAPPNNVKALSGSEIRQRALNKEQLIQVDDIQADIVLGMNKPRQLVIVLDFNINDNNATNSIKLIRQWLADKVLPNVSTLRDIINERKRYRATKTGNTSKAFFTFSLSYNALKLLTNNTDLEDSMSKFSQFGAFAIGAKKRSTFLGDPTTGEGSIETWKFGNKTGNNDCVINLASDIISNDNDNGYSLIEKMRNILLNSDDKYKNLFNIVNSERGDRGTPNTLLYGHEQFGFKDGLSQPESKGKYAINSTDETDEKEEKKDSSAREDEEVYDFVVRRTLSPQDDRYEKYSVPGFNLIDPGNFLLGYGNISSETNIYFPGWAKGSSYMVYRRLGQNVSGLWQDCLEQAKTFVKQNNIGKDLVPNIYDLAGYFAGKLFGRFWDGTPMIFGAPYARYLPPNDGNIGGNNGENNTYSSLLKSGTLKPSDLLDGKQNGFEYANISKKWTVQISKDQTKTVGYIHHDNYPADVGSGHAPNARPQGSGGYVNCPFAGHMRKIQPRDVFTDIGEPSETLKHRMVRRAINYGKRIENIFGSDDESRGLLFITYQSSIENQFEFLQRHWANSDIRPKTSETGAPSDDMIIGQPNLTANGELIRKISFQVALPLLPVRKDVFGHGKNEKDMKTIDQTVYNHTFEVKNIRYVFAEGAGYFLTPPLSAIKLLSSLNDASTVATDIAIVNQLSTGTGFLVNPSYSRLSTMTPNSIYHIDIYNNSQYTPVNFMATNLDTNAMANFTQIKGVSADLFYNPPGNNYDVTDPQKKDKFYKLWNLMLMHYYWLYLWGLPSNQGICYRLPKKDYVAMAPVYNESLKKYGYYVNESECNLQFRSTQELYAIATNLGLNTADLPRVVISWQAFPKRIKTKYPNNFLAACENVEVLGWDASNYPTTTEITWPLARQMDEYCEWFTYRDEHSNKIKKLCITVEPPEYYDFLFKNAPDTLLQLYHEYVSPDVKLDDLIDYNNTESKHERVYDVYNKWNTTHGIMHLNCPPNSLTAEIYIAAESALLWKSKDGKVITNAETLANEGPAALPTRASDPTIVNDVNQLVRDKDLIVSLENPNGLYLQDLDTSGWAKPDGTPFTQDEIEKIVKYRRGNWSVQVGGSEFNAWSRVEIEITDEFGFDLGDMLIGGVPVMWGGQIIDASCTMFLVGIAINPNDPQIVEKKRLLKPNTNPDAAVFVKKLWNASKGIGPPDLSEALVTKPTFNSV